MVIITLDYKNYSDEKCKQEHYVSLCISCESFLGSDIMRYGSSSWVCGFYANPLDCDVDLRVQLRECWLQPEARKTSWWKMEMCWHARGGTVLSETLLTELEIVFHLFSSISFLIFLVIFFLRKMICNTEKIQFCQQALFAESIAWCVAKIRCNLAIF